MAEWSAEAVVDEVLARRLIAALAPEVELSSPSSSNDDSSTSGA